MSLIDAFVNSFAKRPLNHQRNNQHELFIFISVFILPTV